MQKVIPMLMIFLLSGFIFSLSACRAIEKEPLPAGTFKIYPVADAFISTAEENYGNLPILTLGRYEAQTYSAPFIIYFKFDLAGVSADLRIQKVFLKVYGLEFEGFSEGILSGVPDASWLEEEIRWSNAPDFDKNIIWQGKLFLKWNTIDITGFFKQVLRKESFLSLGFWPPELKQTYSISFASKESEPAELRPLLEITYLK